MHKNMLRQVEKSQTLLLNEQSRNMENSGKTIYKFGFGQSPFLPIESAINALRNNAQAKEYSPVQGILSLREKVATFHSVVDGVKRSANDVLIAPGSKILIYAIMAAFKQADVFVPVPSWVSYIPQAQLLGHNAVKIPTNFNDRWRLTPNQLEAALRAKPNADIPSILIINYPGNPDGVTYSAHELEQLAEILRRYNVLVISDEIYGLLHHKGEHKSLASYYPEGTIVTTGLSKWCGAGGWRLGVALLPENIDADFKETLLGIASETYSCAPTPIQIAACAAYEYSEVTKNYLNKQRKILSVIGNYCATELAQAKIAVLPPEGGFYLFVDFSPLKDDLAKRGILTSSILCEKLLADTGVALLPGTAFGMEEEHLCVRLAYVDFDGIKAMEYIDNCLEGKPAIEDICKKIVDGIDEIIAFLVNIKFN